MALLDNTILAETSSEWSQMLVIYNQAKAAARTNLEIRETIQPFELFMSIGHRTKPTVAAPTT